ncbi:MAG: hypothetical protein WD772_09595 [Pseudohongiellaceae bacterium]
MKQADDKELMERIRDALDSSAKNLDGDVLARLYAIRQQATSDTFRNSAAMEADELIQAARRSLDSSTANLDFKIEQQLNQIRRQALSVRSLNQPVGILQKLLDAVSSSRLVMPAGAFATACVLVIALSVSYLSPDPLDSLEIGEELMLLASADELELYENLDFYLWLAENGMPN